MKRFISFSGEVESTAMCVLFGKDATAIFADTGWEHKRMYERLSKVEAAVQELHPTFEVVKIRAEKYPPLPEYIKREKFYPSRRARYCTRIFKIEPIDAYLKDQGECELMIGLNAEEGEMRTGNHGLLSNVNYTYPLFNNGLTRQACIEIIDRVGLRPKLPPYMMRGGCVGCFFKSRKEFTAMAHLAPEEFAEVEEIEQVIQDERGKFYSVREGIKSMAGLRVQAESELFSASEMYHDEVDVSSPCGVFCHR